MKKLAVAVPVTNVTQSVWPDWAFLKDFVSLFSHLSSPNSWWFLDYFENKTF